ncbi:alpha/beta hydrolase family protein [Vagococcus hydrophili]|uniref:Alpha/beta hydrolase n=1 Tax=Vagococcus hydrophili TaxID=2714947 RepID=A0A6G8AWX6_9ENTE|nr:alpha/beta hydrolase [Vagococcus hydrophili]QIL49601.1 alpha/beta hydrolase [Vagococcus hydrophili]
MTSTFIYHSYKNLPLKATLHTPTNESKKGLILYFHGGGLIFGNRNDLPMPYIKELTQAGYSLLALDYPLVPEVKLDVIMTCLETGIQNLAQMPELKHERVDHLIYFGRSAGAYLALQLANSPCLKAPKQIISFYGYYSLEEPLLTMPSEHYKEYKIVPFMTAHSLIQKTPIAEFPIEERFPIYLSYRQTGTWIKELLGRKNSASDFSLTKENLAQLPPTFIAASYTDQDVPFQISQEMSQLIPQTQTFFVENMPHDFDSNLAFNEGINAYQSVISWLDNLNT